MEITMKDKELLELAKKARERAYAPYSCFTVGAALLGKSGRVYLGCNVENAATPAGICAERTALVKAVSEGEKEFSAIAIAGGRAGQAEGICPPCGICRQMLCEFCTGDFRVILAEDEIYPLEKLLPKSFSL